MKFAGEVGRAALFCRVVHTTPRPALLYPASTSKSPSGAARYQLIGRGQ
jgi:hypothetical protein